MVVFHTELFEGICGRSFGSLQYHNGKYASTTHKVILLLMMVVIIMMMMMKNNKNKLGLSHARLRLNWASLPISIFSKYLSRCN
jgi:hypothetical protein